MSECKAKNILKNIKVSRVGLCRRPAVPEAEFVLMKSADDQSSFTDKPLAANGDEREEVAKIAEQLVSGLMGIVRKIRGGSDKASEPVVTEETVDMDISKASMDDIKKANPALYDAIVAKALEGVKESHGSRVGSADVQGSVEESEGERAAKKKVAGTTDAAVTEKKDTVAGEKETSQASMNGGVAKSDFDQLVKSVAEIQKGLGSCLAQMAKFDTSRPGEAEKEKEEKAAVAATQSAVEAEKKKNDSGIGAVKTVDGDTGHNQAVAAELATLKDQVGELKKALEDNSRLANVEKAVAILLRSPERAVAKSADEQPLKKAQSGQAGQFNDGEAKAQATRKTRGIFDGAISTIAMARSGREE